MADGFRSPPPGPTPSDVVLERTLRRAAQIRRRRRLSGAAVVAAAAAAIAVPVGLAGTGGGSARLQVGASPVVPPPRPPTTAPAPACLVSGLSASLDHRRDGDLVGASGRYDDGTTLVLTNSGTSTCTLSGTPEVAFSLASGGEVPASVSATTGTPIVVLRPGQAASSTIRWVGLASAASACAIAVEGLAVTLPGSAATLPVSFDVGPVPCGGGVGASPFTAAPEPQVSTATPGPRGLCTTAELQWVYLPLGSATGADPALFSFEVVNVSGRTCATGDYPGASVTDTSGSPLVVSQGRSDLAGRPVSLTLVPGAVASFAVTVPNVAGEPCTAIGSFHFIAPDDTVRTSVELSGPAVQVCGAGGGTSSVVALQPGVGLALREGAGK